MYAPFCDLGNKLFWRSGLGSDGSQGSAAGANPLYPGCHGAEMKMLPPLTFLLKLNAAVSEAFGQSSGGGDRNTDTAFQATRQAESCRSRSDVGRPRWR